MNMNTKQTVGIVGLGLIGGSFAKAYKESGEWTVYGADTNHKMQSLCQLADDMDGVLDKTTVVECNLLLLALYPQAAIAYLNEMAPYINANTIVIDCCGTKRLICETGMRLAKQYGFTFVGGHPMAGKHTSGYKYADANLFDGTSMIIVPPVFDDIELLDKVRQLLMPARFRHLTVTTAKEHDERIAFTSQMAHVVSNAYVKSPTAQMHDGFSAGSFKDLTRVAWLAEDLWTELFMENKDNLLRELRTLIENLQEYETAMETGDEEHLRELLAEGKRCKEQCEKQSEKQCEKSSKP